jgi:hypothetical protein
MKTGEDILTRGVTLLHMMSKGEEKKYHKRNIVGLLKMWGGESVMRNYSTFNHSLFFNNIQQFIIRIQYIINNIIINNITSQ